MRAQYGVVATENGDTYEMQISLSGCGWRRITAFRGGWLMRRSSWKTSTGRKSSLAGKAIMQNSIDQWKLDDRTGSGSWQYIESSFRITGLEITKSGATDYAIIGTPNDQTDHRPIANLLVMLETSYLNAVSPDLDGIVTRFPHRPPDPQT